MFELGYPETMGVRYPDPAQRRERLERACREILPRIIDEDTERVILFGSTARGDVGSLCDLDLLVVRRDTRRPAERTTDLYRRARPSLAMDLLVYTPEELGRAREESSFIRRILREGRIVYDRRQPLALPSALCVRRQHRAPQGAGQMAVDTDRPGK